MILVRLFILSYLHRFPIISWKIDPELAQMWSYVGSKKTRTDVGHAIDRRTGRKVHMFLADKMRCFSILNAHLFRLAYHLHDAIAASKL